MLMIFIHVLISRKNIYPVYRCKADEIHAVAVPKFIFATHGLKLLKYRWHFYKKFYDCCGGVLYVVNSVNCMAILVAQNLLALFVVWHKCANTLNPPDIVAPMQEPFSAFKRFNKS